jgi:hypothetical protein
MLASPHRAPMRRRRRASNVSVSGSVCVCVPSTVQPSRRRLRRGRRPGAVSRGTRNATRRCSVAPARRAASSKSGFETAH